MKLAEMAKLLALIKEKKTSNFLSTWTLLIVFVLQTENKNEFLILGYADWIGFLL